MDESEIKKLIAAEEDKAAQLEIQIETLKAEYKSNLKEATDKLRASLTIILRAQELIVPEPQELPAKPLKDKADILGMSLGSIPLQQPGVKHSVRST